MFRKFFENKAGIFIFSFALGAIFYILFVILGVGGKIYISDVALSPILGLMFGPIGGLGQSLASFILDVYTGHDVFISFLDSLGLLFISVLSYKLWYSIFKGEKLSWPRLNSSYNILKFIIIMAIAACVYQLWVGFLFKLSFSAMSQLYYEFDFINRFIYGFYFFNYSIIYGFLLISIFNFFKVPFYMPLKKNPFGNINSSYFIVFFIFIAVYAIISFVLDFDWHVKAVAVILMLFSLIIYLINSIDVDLNLTRENYSVIEKIIFVFIAIICLFIINLFDDIMFSLENLSTFGFNVNTVSSIGMTISIITILFLVRIHIRTVEKILTNPINELTDAVNEYASNKTGIDQNSFNLKFKKYLKNDDDISRLLKSFIQLSKNIKSSLDEIRSTTIEKERFETEFDVASKIQANMLPTNFEEFSAGRGFEIYAYMNPAREVGGDFYDYFDIDDENISFLIGDVSGKGIPATLFMVKTMHLMKNHSHFHDDLSDVVSIVNDLSCQRNDKDLFVTSWVGKLNLKSGEISYVNAGHNPPLIRQNNGDFEYLKERANLVLGGIGGIPYTAKTLNFKPGDMIFLYTDGITEANNNYHGFYGDDRLREILNKFKDESLSTIITEIKEDVGRFCDNPDQFDDETMIILRYTGGQNDA
ncbi:PP2C family protein-serine/threonine phosphatase [Methanobrevibacter sp.]|uniref:PP2C family protein-serine/threonine phosphatase n=1 Tax=Methanobrevibacter sp. TaxID=66852 RepID=UPI0038911079